jgi:hypothetical protein
MTAPDADLTPEQALQATRDWIDRAVIGLNLCPFARAVSVKGQIRYVVSAARAPAALLEELQAELRFLAEAPPDEVDTTVLIHPWVLQRFRDYNDFLGVADRTLRRLGLAGALQIASFHPEYQFAGTEPDDVTNYTNRSPYPILHLLREASVSRAVAAFPDAERIYGRNLETMRRLGPEGCRALLEPGRGNAPDASE